ncbi:hypothetical protein Tco_0521943 [Tanacetum coccineum]
MTEGTSFRQLTTCNMKRPVSTRLQLHEQALFCYYDAFLTLVEPKIYKDALTQACWIEALQEELNEFECLEVWDSDPVDNPMVEKSKLDEDTQGKAVDPTHYHGIVGTLMYLTASRPDLTFVVCMRTLVSQNDSSTIALTAYADDYHCGLPRIDNELHLNLCNYWEIGFQNQRDLPRDIPLDSVVVLRYEKRSKSENKGKVSTEMELVLEQTQQGTSYEVSVSAEGVEELKRKVKIKGEKKEALLILRQKPAKNLLSESQRMISDMED